MANRTFKVYGQAYAESGDVSVAMSVNGTEVFNGAVNDSTTPREGQPTTENHLWTYELDENTVGELAVSIAVTGGELCLGPTSNNLNKAQVIPDSWFSDRPGDTVMSAENQTYLANTIGQARLDAEQAGLYDKLIAGTATIESDSTDILNANRNGPRNLDGFAFINDLRTNLAIDGNANADSIASASTGEEKAVWWPIVQDGETFTYTWTFDPDADAF